MDGKTGADTECWCSQGTMYYGLAEDPVSHSDLDTFDKMRNWKVATRKAEAADAYMTCQASSFGLSEDFFPEVAKRCWCEWEPTHDIHLCAKDGGDCMCKGNVFFMLDDGKKDFYVQSGGDWTWNSVNNTGSIKCAASTFENIDPQPGQDKACFCDDNKKLYNEA